MWCFNLLPTLVYAADDTRILWKADLILGLLPQLLLHLIILTMSDVSPSDVVLQADAQLFDPSSRMPFSTGLFADGVYNNTPLLTMNAAGTASSEGGELPDRTLLLPVRWAQCTTPSNTSACIFPLTTGTTFLAGQPIVSSVQETPAKLHTFSTCSQYDTSTDHFNALLGMIQLRSTLIALGLAVAALLTGWISRKDRLRHDVHRAGTITCEMQEFIFSKTVTDPDLFLKARLLPYAGMQSTEHVRVSGEVEAIVPNHERHSTLMHFDVEPNTKPVLYLELWNDECNEVDEFGERLMPPKLVAHRLIPIDEVKWFTPTKYWFTPSSYSLEELDEFYAHFVGYHWQFWALLLRGWLRDGLASLWRKPRHCLKAAYSNLCGIYHRGSFDDSHVVCVSVVFSIPTGGMIQDNDRSASAVERVTVRSDASLGAVAPKSVRGHLIV